MNLRNKKSKGNQLTVFYKVFNEADFIEASLKSVYPYADKIVIFEYCLESMHRIIRPDRVTERGLSVDGTTEIIQDFTDPDNKIEYCPAGFLYGAESIPYQMIVDTAVVGEYIWVVDGDIVIPEKLAKNIRRWVDKGEYDVLWVPERVFYHDLYHEKTLFLAHHQRVFRKPHRLSFYIPSCFEVQWFENDGITDKSMRWLKREPEFEWDGRVFKSKTLDPETDGFGFHYALARSTQKVLEKFLWQYEMIDRRWRNEREQRTCADFKDVLEFKLKTHDWFLNHEPNDRAPFTGKHPKATKGNPWLDIRWNERGVQITYDEARALIGNPGACV